MTAKNEPHQVYSLVASDGTRFVIEQRANVGRGKDSHIKILNKKISRNHATLKVENNQLLIKDLGSSNGTSVNDQIISTEVQLAHGDHVKFDNIQFTVAINSGNNSDQTIVPKAKSFDNNNSQKQIPDSWIEESTTAINGTRMMNLAQLEALKTTERLTSNNDSTVHQLHCFVGDEGEQVIKLEINSESTTQVWEIGRSPECDIVLKHPSVSKKHAQLIHQNGRWKIVNLVSTNGILINGQKKLSAFLSDDDKIVLGSTSIIFQTPLPDNTEVKTHSLANKKTVVMVLVSTIVLAVAVLVWKFI